MKREIPTGDLAVELVVPDPVDVLAGMESRAELHRALAKLTALQFEVVELYFIERLSQREIARRFGVSQQAISARLGSALDRKSVV